MQKQVKQAIFWVLQKKSTLSRVVWAEKSKTGLGFEIGPNYDNVPTRSQLLADRQSSCSLS